MTDLTEKWKSGELEQGWYYINSGDIDYKYSKYNSADFFVTPYEDIKEILAPVPSYEEREKLAEENKQLKELLNYIRDEIADMPVYAKQMGFGWISEAAYRIDNAIGEK